MVTWNLGIMRTGWMYALKDSQLPVGVFFTVWFGRAVNIRVSAIYFSLSLYNTL